MCITHTDTDLVKNVKPLRADKESSDPDFCRSKGSVFAVESAYVGAEFILST